ncbi:MAG: 16S rRNA (uracil(1498)-N(3))-methyltransferase [Cyclobacteriaceae bacterium]
MNLFYQPHIADGILNLNAEESRHAIKVLRMVKGDALHLTDGKGFFYTAQITEADAKKCSFEIIDKKQSPKRDYQIHIAIAPTKNADRMEWFVEKATEIGIDKISFILCRNSERKTINLDRIEKIAISAMKQSGQAWLPKVSSIVPFNEVLKHNVSQKFIAFVDEKNTNHLKSVAKSNGNYLVLVGPEGDFSQEELNLALENNFKKVSLGNNRLRTETAGLVACQVLNLINN